MPTPKPKYAIRTRRGKPILVNMQIIRWRKQRRKERLKAKAEAARTLPPTLKNIFDPGAS